MQVKATNVQLSSDAPSSASSDDDASATVSTQQDIELIESEPDELEATQALSPPPPTLPLIENVISFVINGNEAGERSFEVDMNEDYGAFQSQLDSYVNKKLPTGLSRWSEDVKVSYQRAYVTKPQERKRKNMPWKDFFDERDYSGLLNAIRSESKPSKMVIVVRAFITIPKDKFEEEVELVIASQRLVLS
jgi:hypothetical protein